ncbi:MAG TPA: PEP-CTERM sorting domain-containing protein, partial [Pirellulales bacterium]|nr:PEP-CTERM sorting domain-containing protein [Pirellulales bacterium]
SLSIGGNDYGGNALKLLTGQVDPVVLGNQVTANISTAVDNVLSAHPDGMIVWSVPDMSLTAEGQTYVTTPQLQALAAQIMADVNPQLEAAMLSRHVVYIDLASAMHDLEASPLVVGGVTIDTKNASTDPTHLWQNNIHPGTVGNGLFANLAIAALNVGYGQHIPYFTDQEILAQAGLSGSYTGQTTNIDYASYIVTAPVPEPGSLALLVIGALFTVVGYRSRRRRIE